MNTQLDIFAPPSTIDAAFWKFHNNNPQIFDKLVEMTFTARRSGARKIGMKMLFEVLRWDSIITTQGDAYKLCNSYTSRYVRVIEERYPELIGMFEKRTIHS